MSVTLVLILALAVALFVIILVAKTCRSLQEEKTRLEMELSKQKSNMAYLVKHAEEIATIEKDKDQVQEDIRNAKSDEEVADIINTIININNAGVRQQTKG